MDPVTGPSSFMFEGGYFLYALGVATVIFCAITAQSGSLSRALGNLVFRYVGRSPTGPISGIFLSSPCWTRPGSTCMATRS